MNSRLPDWRAMTEQFTCVACVHAFIKSQISIMDLVKHDDAEPNRCCGPPHHFA